MKYLQRKKCKTHSFKGAWDAKKSGELSYENWKALPTNLFIIKGSITTLSKQKHLLVNIHRNAIKILNILLKQKPALLLDINY